jgi:tungstate transport system permease protein
MVMDGFLGGLTRAVSLLLDGDAEVYGILLLTLRVSATATVVAVLLGVPAGLALAFRDFPGRRLLVSVANFGMGLPPVVVGLLVSLLLWRYGPLGSLGILYTPTAMVVAQAVIASPVVASLSFAAAGALNPDLRLQLLSLGATRWQAARVLIQEARLGLMAAVMAGFGAVVSEVGASMMVGGNIKGQTRVLTTATVMEVGKGNYELAVALGVILLVVAYLVFLGLTWLQHPRRSEQP